MKKIIGCYNKSVILTYMGLAVEILGIMLANLRKIDYGIICLIIAGIFDGFDGTIAKKIKRTETEKNFGIQIDSLNDIIGSIILPIILMLGMKFTNWYNYIIYTTFALAGMIRLSYFNVVTKEDKKNFIGLPVTTSNIVIPLIYISTKQQIIYMTAMIAISLGYILNIKIKKLSFKEKIAFSIIGIIVISSIIFLGRK